MMMMKKRPLVRSIGVLLFLTAGCAPLSGDNPVHQDRQTYFIGVMLFLSAGCAPLSGDSPENQDRQADLIGVLLSLKAGCARL
eukprot:8290922-Karenia_brevis.AAC.1